MTLLLVTLGLALVGCEPKPPVSVDALALRRVVIYRNGVGYFERAGHVNEGHVDFKVKAGEVGDFLASLAVIERGGSSVRAASFPIKVPGEASDPPAVPKAPTEEQEPASPHPSTSPPEAAPPRHGNLETVVLELDGKEHDLQIGYIAETPVWRPSYRLIVERSGAELQAWGIVQNLSGEDWNGVSLSLIAGAPLAFETSLGTPAIPERPTVTDSGEVIAAVPQSETTLSQSAAAAPPPPAPAPEIEANEGNEPSDKDEEAAPAGPAASRTPAHRAAPARMRKASPKSAMGAGELASAPRPAMVAMGPAGNPSAPRNLAALAGIAVEGGATRYDIPTPINVPDRSATMVMLLSKQVPGEAVFLYAPDGGVPDSQSHPFRVARFTNVSGGLLERGPIAVFEDGAFLGQGMVDPLPAGATATVPFALERSLAVDQSRTFGEEGARVVQIEAGDLTIERDAVTKTTYRVRNGGDKAAKLLVKHPRTASTALHDPPKGTEDNVGTGSALAPIDVESHKTAELVIDERQPVSRTIDWLSPFADMAVRAYWEDRRADPDAVAKLKKAWDIRAVLVRLSAERASITSEKNELERATEETRQNLKALERNRLAADLRNQLVERLARNSLRLEAITKRTIELDQQLAEGRVRFTEIVRSLKVSVPPSSLAPSSP